MAFTSNLAAINAANASIKGAYAAANLPALSVEQMKEARKLHFSIEKVDGEYHALVIAPLPQAAPARDPLSCLLSERDPAAMAFDFPTAKGIAFEATIELEQAAIAAAESAQSQVSAPEPAAGQQAFASAAAFFASRSAAASLNLSQAPIDDEGYVDDADEPSDQDEAEADEAFANAQKNADAAANAQQATSELKNGKIWIHASSCESPVKRVWAIADAMIAAASAANQPKPSRKEIQDECVRQGVASGTARTQYQAWKKANDNAQENAANAQALSDAWNARNRALQSS